MIKKNMAGTKLTEFEFPVERGKIKEFASAICDPNPVYRDREYARDKGFDDILMPVTFPMTFGFFLPSENYMFEAITKLGLDTAKMLGGEMEILYQRPVCAGETLRGELIIGDIYEKESKASSKMTFIEFICNFYDRKDKLVVLMRNTGIERS